MNKPLHQIYADLNTPIVATKEQYHSAVILLASIVGVAILCLFSSCSMTPARAESINLTASWYSIDSLKKEGTYKYSKGVMANGQKFRNEGFTCASRDYELKTILKITNLDNGKSVSVRVSDKINKRFKGKRIDLSKLAFSRIAELKKGIVPVKVEVLTH
jgi:rare lipoprotein A